MGRPLVEFRRSALHATAFTRTRFSSRIAHTGGALQPAETLKSWPGRNRANTPRWEELTPFQVYWAKPSMRRVPKEAKERDASASHAAALIPANMPTMRTNATFSGNPRLTIVCHISPSHTAHAFSHAKGPCSLKKGTIACPMQKEKQTFQDLLSKTMSEGAAPISSGHAQGTILSSECTGMGNNAACCTPAQILVGTGRAGTCKTVHVVAIIHAVSVLAREHVVRGRAKRPRYISREHAQPPHDLHLAHRRDCADVGPHEPDEGQPALRRVYDVVPARERILFLPARNLLLPFCRVTVL